MPDDVTEKIKKDLLKSGFPLELHVSSLFEKRDWNVLQNEYVSEKNSEEAFEVDIIATKMFEANVYGIPLKLLIKCIIECKKSAKHHWVFFTRDRQAHDKAHILIKHSSNFGTNKPFRIKNQNPSSDAHFFGKTIDYESLRMFDWNRKATGYYQAFRKPDKENEIYKAVRTLLRNLQIISNSETRRLFNGRWTELIIQEYIPIIVVDGLLFQTYLKEQDLNITEIDNIPLIVNSDQLNDKQIMLNIMKKGSVNSFIDTIEMDAKKLLQEYSKLTYIVPAKLL